MAKRVLHVIFAILVHWTGVTVCWADNTEFSLLGGAQGNSHKTTFTFELEYLRRFESPIHWAASLAAVQEGHFEEPVKHHRDGFASQAWLYGNLGKRLSLATGIGPYLYYDTGTNREKMGAAPIVSVDARIKLNDDWFLRCRTNYVFATDNNTLSFLVGFGRQLDSSIYHQHKFTGSPNELVFLASRSIVITAYHRSLMSYLDWSLSYMHEIDRGAYGAASQLWLVDRCFNNKLKLGFGAGPYYDLRRSENGLSSIISIAAELDLDIVNLPDWGLRIQGDRIHTKLYNDADINSVGITYRF
jgi:hypothetical protein